jgi:hypothetical protein
MAETAPNGAIWLVPLAKLLAALALHALICLPLKKLGFSASARIKTARDQRSFQRPRKSKPAEKADLLAGFVASKLGGSGCSHSP